MSRRQSDLIQAFVKKGATSGIASSMYVDGDVLYSYGRHFPLLLRTEYGFLMNADRYSVSTSQHQSRCMRHATIQVPFSALRAAGLVPSNLKLVDYEAQRWDWHGKYDYHSTEGYRLIGGDEYAALTDVQKSYAYKHQERRPESAVLRTGTGDYYLSSMDGYSYFLCRLPEPVKTVTEAFASLKPKEVIGDDYVRQGEWFFVQTDDLPRTIFDKGGTVEQIRRWFYKQMPQSFVLPQRNPSGNPHIATRGFRHNDDIFVSGQIRHVALFGGRGDHPMLQLSKADNPLIFKAYENRALGSWSAGGRVD